MVIQARTIPVGQQTAIESLLELTRSAGEENLSAVLATVAQTVCAVGGYQTVVVNIYRPAWDDYEVIYVIGSAESHAALDGTRAPSATWNRLFETECQRLPGVFFLTREAAFWEGMKNIYIPDLPDSEDPDAWRSEDGLIVFLRDGNGTPLGFLSVDVPLSGRRPTEDDLRLLRAICSHAEQALVSARRNERAAENERMLSQLLAAAPALSACSTPRMLLETACQTVVPKLGFERISAYYLRDEDTLELTATRGWDTPAPLARRLEIAEIETLLSTHPEHAGCWLLESDVELPGGQHRWLGERRAAGARSHRNGHGPAAWNDHRLVVPSRGGEGDLHALIVVEDPVDRLLPTDERRRAVRLLIEQVSAAQSVIEHRAQLSHLASHDPLTGVRNRRGLTDLLAEHAGAAVIICDIDHFKEVNDRHGHNVGDLVLARFGELLRELCRDQDVAIRLGGEEFCVVLPGTDRTGAMAAAERLRAETARRMRDLVPAGITVSVGVAVDTERALDPGRLLSAADRGLYEAKQAGRDRSIALAIDDARQQAARTG
ncbi:MAG TPA: GGDEF domain-containing protein [Solirubrobacteraceae bacterium]